jgi:hypothetical protein
MLTLANQAVTRSAGPRAVWRARPRLPLLLRQARLPMHQPRLVSAVEGPAADLLRPVRPAADLLHPTQLQHNLQREHLQQGQKLVKLSQKFIQMVLLDMVYPALLVNLKNSNGILYVGCSYIVKWVFVDENKVGTSKKVVAKMVVGWVLVITILVCGGLGSGC